MLKAKKSLFVKSPEVEFLRSHCTCWVSKAAFHIRRLQSRDELRNRALSVKTRLDELDADFGRADKNLSHCLVQNRDLAAMGFFSAAAKRPK